MAFGILEASTDNVPGTVYIHDEEKRIQDLLSTNATLHRSKDGKTILVPQPNVADPNDPLLLPLWQRDMRFGICCFCALVATCAAPMLSANTVQVSLGLHINFEQGAWLTGWHLLAVGLSVLVVVPWARVWGKRSTFIAAQLLMIAASAWAGTTRASVSHKQLVWARVLQGMAVGPFESLLNTCVGDLYYVHERGPRMAVSNVCLFAGSFLVPIIVGKMSVTIGWEWSFWCLAIIQAFTLVLFFFLVPETAYRRPLYLETDLTAQKSVSTETLDSSSSSPSTAEANEKDAQVATTEHQQPVVAPKTYLQKLLPFDGRKTDDSFFFLFLRPFPLLINPAILWGMFMTGCIIGWTVMVGVVISFLFFLPPLSWSEEKTGTEYTGPVIASIVGLFGSAIYNELLTKYLVRHNHGKYEPEYRLLLCVPAFMFAATGLFGFGVTTARLAHYGPIVVGVFFSFIILSVVTSTIACGQYILDAYRAISIEAFTNLIMFKNVFSFVLTYYSYRWVLKNGINNMFYIFGGIQMGIYFLTIPLYMFGKRNRAFFHKHDVLKMTGLNH